MISRDVKPFSLPGEVMAALPAGTGAVFLRLGRSCAANKGIAENLHMDITVFSSRLGNLVRASWIVALIAVALSYIPMVQRSFVLVNRVCTTDTDCISGQLTRAAAAGLRTAGLSPAAYAVYYDALLVGIVAVFAAVAGTIVWRRPTDPMALLTAFTLLLFGGITFANSEQVVGTASPWFTPVNILSMLGSIAIGIFLYLFPSGMRSGSSIFTRVVLPSLMAMWAVLQVASYLGIRGPLDYNDPQNPFGFAEWLFFLGTMGAVQVYRYRTVSDSIQQQQTKWVVLGVCTSLDSFIILIFINGFVGVSTETAAGYIALETCLRLVMLPIPISIAFAVLRQRLWDVDILINRTIVYAALTASVALFYLGGVIVFQAIFRAVAGQNSELAIALTTLLIAGLFNPWRRRLQVFIDRRFYRNKYDAARVLASLQTRLRDEVDLDRVRADLVSAIHETVQPD